VGVGCVAGPPLVQAGKHQPVVAVVDEGAELAEALRREQTEGVAIMENMSSTERRKVAMNDNMVIAQLRTELFERSSKMKDMFRRLDTDGSGSLSLLEFRKGLQRSGFTDMRGQANTHRKGLDRGTLVVSIADTVRLFNYFDEDGDGQMKYGEFMHLLQNSTKVDYNKRLMVGTTDI